MLLVLARAISQLSRTERPNLFRQAIRYVPQSDVWEAQGLIAMLCLADDAQEIGAFSEELEPFLRRLDDFCSRVVE